MPEIITGTRVPYGHPDVDTVYINGVEWDSWMSFRVVKKLNQLWTFEVYLVDVQNSDKTNVKEGNIIMIFDEFRLLIKGRIDRIEYQNEFDCIIRGYSMEIKLMDSWFERTSYTNSNLTTIVNDIIANTGLTLGTISDFGTTISARFEYDNKLRSMSQLQQMTDFDFWVSNEGADYSTDTINFSSWKGSIVPSQLFYLSGDDQNCYVAKREKDVENLINSIKMTGYGDGVNQTTISSYLATTSYSTLESDCSADDIYLHLVDATSFPGAGSIVMIGNEAMACVGMQGNQLTVIRDKAAGNNAAYKKGSLVTLFHDSVTNWCYANIGGISSTATTITAGNGTFGWFAAAGTAIVGKEIITYTSKDDTHLYGCSRGQSYTFSNGQTYTSTATAHSSNLASPFGPVVMEFDSTKLYVPQNPQTGSSISSNGLKDKVIVDKSLSNTASIVLATSNYLINYNQPIERITLNIWNPRDITADLGDNIEIYDTETDLAGVYRLVGKERTSDNESGDQLILEVNNYKLSMLEDTNLIKKTSENQSTYAQGATNITQIQNQGVVNSGNNLDTIFYIPSSMVKFNYCKLSFRATAAYNGTLVVTAGLADSESSVGSYTSNQTDIDISDNINFLVNGSGWYNVHMTNSNATGNTITVMMEVKGFIESK